MLKFYSKIYKPRSNIYVNTAKMIIEYELPGVKKDDISVDCNGTHLILKAKKMPNIKEFDSINQVRSERVFGKIERIFPLPEEADLEHIDAHLSDGVLTVTIPRTFGKKLQVKVN